MRAGLNTIQQTLTPEAATVLNNSIAEAGRRNHGQTTPLHVAATLLSSPSGFLQQACVRSHPNSSNPRQCRALEICFSVALERLPTSQNASPGLEPPISNALMAALKRAQAHQRRGCPEQQQQPLLAVKVELEQLVISILDDPSVSRVMREASFSSPAVKATIEQTLNSQTNSANNPSIGLGFRPQHMAAAPTPCRNLYLNPRLQQSNATQSGNQRTEDVKKVIDILSRNKKKNPVLVGDSEPDLVVKEVLKRIENKELDGEALRNIEVIHLQKDLPIDRTQLPNKIKELGIMIGNRISNCNGVILDLGDLKWLVEQPVSLGISGSTGVPPQQIVSETGRAAVTEMGDLLKKFDEGGAAGRVWLIGTATCETYLRCQVYHSTMEKDWDLQAVPITAKLPLSGMFPRLGTNGNLISPAESFTSMKSFQNPATARQRRLSENSDHTRKTSCCPQCMESYDQELAKHVGKVSEKSSSQTKSEAMQPSLPMWLQNAKSQNNDVTATDQSQAKDQDLIVKHQSQELLKKWNSTCLNLHPNFHRSLAPTPLPMTGLYNQNLLGRQSIQPKLSLTRHLGGETLHLNPTLVAVKPNERAEQAVSTMRSPIRTDLALGQTKNSENPEITHKERIQDLLGCISSESQIGVHNLHSIKIMTSLEADFADTYKKLLKGLSQKVWWQPDAASAIATTVTQHKLSCGKRQGGTGSKSEIWFFFTGPDRVGKKKMAYVLSEQAGGAYPIIISLGSRRSYEESNTNIRGRTVLDRIAEAVRRNPFSVIMLEDIDEADLLIRGSIKRAMERGRLADSHGREISLGNVIFILTSNWLPDNLKSLSNNLCLDEEKLAISASGGWQLRLAISEKTGKRRANWLLNEDRSTKSRKDNSGLGFDLNETADLDDKAGGSLNSSDLTIDYGLVNMCSPIDSPSRELLNSVDESIAFKPVDSDLVRDKFSSYISTTFSTIVDEKFSIEVQDQALEKILGGVWLGRIGLEEWVEKYLVPSFRQLKSRLASFNVANSGETTVVRLELDDDSGSRGLGDWLPSKINLHVDE